MGTIMVCGFENLVTILKFRNESKIKNLDFLE
jgi:hypothetical protein